MNSKRDEYLRLPAGKTFWTILLFLVIFFNLLLFYPRPLHEFPAGEIASPRTLTGASTTTYTGTTTGTSPGTVLGSGTHESLAPDDTYSNPLTSPPENAATEGKHLRLPDRQVEREQMVQVIRSYGFEDETVLQAMSRVPRHEFVPAGYSQNAYDDGPLPIGYGQTISQPYIVAEMTRLLQLSSTSRVLEIGTGSGYQAAILTEFTPQVYTLEIVSELADEASKRLKRLGYETVKVRAADGWNGWPAKGPFDGIIVTCAAGQIPPALVRQLAPGGRMAIPVGSPFSPQWLMLVTKNRDGSTSSQCLMGVQFVPFIHENGPNR
ncbi:MAG: protein-L-isoaspartate(D-aspartate) O-methyltransferase [Candidatus Ozemobacteraceae bacterium]